MRTLAQIKDLWIENTNNPDSLVINDILRFAYNLALQDAAENAETIWYGDYIEDGVGVDKESILKLKI